MDSGTVGRIARRFILRNFRNVRTVRIIEIGTALSGERWVYKAVGLASINLETITPTLGSAIPVEVLVAQDGTVVTVQGQMWNNYQRAHKASLRHKRDAKGKI